ncbi:MAG: hypothetical protein FGF53_09735 [Candidatus Brockarchaeota archaeon]|nr:hypothetical protein [Candidatus Brockarchaeota archaeon]
MFPQSAGREIKAMILSKLRNRGCWGARYMPLDTLVRWLSRMVERNGKRVQKAVRQLVNEGHLILHKGGETVSLNPARSREILELIGT